MSEEIKQVQAVSDSVKYAIRRKSAYSLPTNPSERGMTPDEIRRAFYAPITEATQSVLAEIDRVISETNEGLLQIRENGESEVSELQAALDTFKEKVDKTVEKYSSALDALNQHVSSLTEHVDRKVERENPMTEGTMIHTGNASFTTLSAEELTVPRLSEAYVDIERNKSDLEQNRLDIISLRAEISGKGRIFCLEDFLSLVDFLRYGGTGEARLWLLENGEAVYYTAADLKTGDVIYIKEINVPDVWWIATDSSEGAYVYSYNDADYELVGYHNGVVIGQVQPLETDYLVIEGHAQSASLSAQKAADEADRAEEQANRATEEVVRAEEAAVRAENYVDRKITEALEAVY